MSSSCLGIFELNDVKAADGGGQCGLAADHPAKKTFIWVPKKT